MSAIDELNKAVWEVLDEIKQEDFVTPDDEWILISTHTDERWRAVRYLAKLGAIKAREHSPLGSVSAIKLVQEMNGRVYKPNAYKIEIQKPKFNQVFDVYERTHIPVIDSIKETTTENLKITKAASKKENKIFWITYQGRNIILNTLKSRYRINKLQFNRDNEVVFDYIFGKSGMKITGKEINKATSKTVDFNKFVDAVGFKGELRKAFFDVSKTAIKFMNEINAKELEDRGVDIVKLTTQVEKLREFSPE